MRVRKRDQQFRKVGRSMAWFGEDVNVVEEMQFDVPLACEWNELELLMLGYSNSFLSMRWLGIARFHSHFVHRSRFVLFVVGMCIVSCVVRLRFEILPWEKEIARDECLGVLHQKLPISWASSLHDHLWFLQAFV